MKTNKFLTLALLGVTFFAACDKDDDLPTNGNLTLNISGLENLGPEYTYEGWLIVDGQPVTTGTFDVDADGNLSQSTFSIKREYLETATTFVLTIEPAQDPDPAPSKVHKLGGNLAAGEALLSVAHPAAIGNDFTSSMGNYILATPTNGANNDEKSGIWFLDINSGSPTAGLSLPTLPDGWIYEGWVVVAGKPVTTGKFSSVSGSDLASPFSGSQQSPPFPGEDFLENAPASLTFPIDLSGAKAVISIEPVPDNSDAPFLLKPLLGDIPANAADHKVYTMNNIASGTNPTGSVSILIQ